MGSESESASRPAVNLETELTCSICTDLLYNPLTLLDCLHTYCGACLASWFAWQAARADARPLPPREDEAVFTCPSCRDRVRDTKHDARVATLLDMFLGLNPERAKSAADRAEMDARYTRGAKVMPRLKCMDRSEAQKRADEEERRVLEEVQRSSLQEALEAAGRADRQARGRELEHQTSLRSLISAAEGEGVVGTRDLEREIEEFTRQIQEEGLLEGTDLDNIDLSTNEELRKRITEAYRRRFADIRERERHSGGRRSNASSHSHRSDVSARPRAQTGDSRPTSRQGGGRSRPHSVSDNEERGRYPPSASTSAHLEPGEPTRRRRTPSGGRSATAPTAASQPEVVRTGAVRSQTDLAIRPSAGILADARSTSSPTTTSSASNGGAPDLPFNARAAVGLGITTTPTQPAADSDSDRRRHTPTSATTSGPLTPPGTTTTTASPSRRQHAPLYPEPLITCRRCARPHIEYTLHFNCSTCASGDWNICLDCWRRRLGCLHWFGFGQAAWERFRKLHPPPTTVPPPHFLTANRYLPPPRTPGGAEGRRTLTADDPVLRLQSGTFCCRCEAWTNEGYWRCDVCNEGEWGFCTGCVVQGKGCGHALLPMKYQGEKGGFRVVGVTPGCRGGCGREIEGREERFHCYECSEGGSWDVCAGCYKEMVPGRVAVENGAEGWRRCLRGHRMVVEVYGKDGWKRTVRGLVGGRRLGGEKAEEGVERWWWEGDEGKVERMVAVDVKRSVGEGVFPPDGGEGGTAVARWAWYPAEGVVDELLFPKWAGIEEVRDENGEWSSGWYMGKEGLFPTPYVTMAEGKGATK